ncbi:MAG: bifunctional folylpolyglutamate synthase/dihydrofolate synthase [Vicinamibacteria bacterium]
MDHAAAVAYLVGHERLGIKFGLENIGLLVEALEHPERCWQSILIAGTNGKGSTTALLESILRAAGLRTGRYTSPHLVRLEERIMANGELISPDELVGVVEKVKFVTDRLRQQRTLLADPTFFELTTACALEFFRLKEIDVAVIEVGMGGRWDATNIVPAGLSAVTNVGLDHERFLGSTVRAIAAEKAAIIKPGRPVVTSVADSEPLAVIRAEADRQRAPLFEVPREVTAVAKEAERGQWVRMETRQTVYPELFLPLIGAHQVENLSLAVRVAELTSHLGFRVSSEAVSKGVASTVWEGRLERVGGSPDLILDAAHNPMGAAALARYFEDHPHSDRVLLYGVLKDKKSARMLDLLAPQFQHLIVTRPPSRRAQDPEVVSRQAERLGFKATAVDSPEQALAKARRLAGGSGEVLVAGSIFLVGEVKRILANEAGTELAEAKPVRPNDF